MVWYFYPHLSSWPAMTKYHMGGKTMHMVTKTMYIYISWFWGLESPEKGIN